MASFDLKTIEMAGIFSPTEDEFTDPLGYISKIRPVAEKYGICKIVPPKSWSPKFCLDMDEFKFTPRVQKLNELEAVSRIKLNFLLKLSKFWELQGQKFKIPTLERKQLDLYKLNKLVDEAGGFEALIKSKKWSTISKSLGLKEPTSTRIIKIHFEKILYPFLLFESGVTLPASNLPKRPNESGNSETESSPIKKTKKNKCHHNEETQVKQTVMIESIECLVCGRGDDEAMMLLCDGCDDSYHTYCLFPPLKEIPKGDWRCPMCISEICKKPTDSYGFVQSESQYSLNEFGKMADQFKTEYFKKAHQEVGCDEVEEAFWKILSNPNEEVSVEYGADLHTLDKGSGFPTRRYNSAKITTENLEYLDHPWNLNNLSKTEKSVLSQMNVDISGMKVPWAYVGMCFSCFCWHVEDHWSYSINYMHWGATKTWYGVSGDHAEAFEACMKANANELFEKSPDLLHHLVTIMDPSLLIENGVPIYKIHQNVGEFVITFPRAYHAGFNQGFNFAEAVNFCPADWMRLGRAAIENYKQMKRHTVFSHDELVCKIATSLSLSDMNIIEEIQKELEFIIEVEKKERRILSEKKIFKKSNKVSFESLTDDERTCTYCKTTCFISAIYCSCSKNTLACLEHHEHLCKKVKTPNCSPSKRSRINHEMTLIYRYTTDEMTTILKRLNNYSREYHEWCENVADILSFKNICENEATRNGDVAQTDSTRSKPKLKRLLDLLEQAKVRNYPRVKVETKISSEKVNLLAELEVEFKNAQVCADYCLHFINVYKKSVKTIGGGLDELKSIMKVEVDCEVEDGDLIDEVNSDDDVIFLKKSNQSSPSLKKRIGIDRLRTLVATLDTLVCQIDEQPLLMSIFNEALEYEKKIDRLIADWNIESPNQLKRLINYLSRIDIQFPALKVEQLKIMHRQAVWLNAVNLSIQNPNELTIRLLTDLIDRVIDENLLVTFNDSHASKDIVEKTFVDLQELLSISQTWDTCAKEQLTARHPFKLEDLEQTISEAKCIPARMENVERLVQVVAAANSWKAKSERLFKIGKELQQPSSCYPYLTEFIELLDQANSLPVKLPVGIVQMKIELVNEWITRLNKLFNTTKLHKNVADSSIDTSALLEVLTPRLEVASVLNRLQASCSGSEVANKSSKKAKTSAKLIEAESLEESSQESLRTATEIYSTEKDFFILREQLRQLELKELILLKKLRAFNQETISLWKTSFNSQVLKCSACYKQIQSKQMIAFKQCRLCLGVFHANNSCRTGKSQIESGNKGGKHQNSSTISDYLKQESGCIVELCYGCRRSKRPSLEQVLDSLVAIDKLEIRSYETNALQLFVERVLNWQDRFKRLCGVCSEVKIICGLGKQGRESVMKIYNEIPDLRRSEINDLGLESLLLEVDMPEIRELQQILSIVGEEVRLFEVESKVVDVRQIDSVEEDQIAVESQNNSTDENSDEEGQALAGGINNKHSNSGSNVNRKKMTKKESGKLITNKQKKITNNKSSNSVSDCDTSMASNKKKINNSSCVSKRKKELSSSPKKDEVNETSTVQDVTNDDSEASNDEEACAAENCLEPMGDNIKWVQCDNDKCNRWFHMICVGLTKIRKKETYLCNSCKQTEIKLEPYEKPVEEITPELDNEEGPIMLKMEEDNQECSQV